jgi:hypothetical protein
MARGRPAAAWIGQGGFFLQVCQMAPLAANNLVEDRRKRA